MEKSKSGMLGVILAGGRGRRLGGRDKSLLIYHGERLVEKAYRLLEIFCERIVVTGPDVEKLKMSGIEILKDVSGVQGPVGGVLAGLRQCEESIFILGVDQFGVSENTVERILKRGEGKGASFLCSKGQAIPTISYISVGHLKCVESAIAGGVRSLQGIFQAIGTEAEEAKSGEVEDVDSEEDARRWGIQFEHL